MEEAQHIARLLVSCPDRHGIVAAVSGFLSEHDANILSSDQHSTDPEGGTFFMRMEFHLERLLERRDELEREFAERVAEPLDMDWRFAYADRRKRTALLASRDDHCLLDLLWRWRRGELETDIVCVVSNHRITRPTSRASASRTTTSPRRREGRGGGADARAAGVDLVVLARYMQILSRDFLDRLGVPVINIHHSFLPAFVGADPYRRARERGVKIIGATAHYVTEELDAGPIIEQDVARVSHRQGVEELERIGRDIERVVLARAVRGTSRTACSCTRTARSSSEHVVVIPTRPTGPVPSPGRGTRLERHWCRSAARARRLASMRRKIRHVVGPAPSPGLGTGLEGTIEVMYTAMYASEAVVPG